MAVPEVESPDLDGLVSGSACQIVFQLTHVNSCVVRLRSSRHALHAMLSLCVLALFRWGWIFVCTHLFCSFSTVLQIFLHLLYTFLSRYPALCISFLLIWRIVCLFYLNFKKIELIFTIVVVQQSGIFLLGYALGEDTASINVNHVVGWHLDHLRRLCGRPANHIDDMFVLIQNLDNAIVISRACCWI